MDLNGSKFVRRRDLSTSLVLKQQKRNVYFPEKFVLQILPKFTLIAYIVKRSSQT